MLPEFSRAGAVAAWIAFTLGALFAAVSAYWGLGGTWLLDTVGGSLAEAGRRRDVGLIAVVWVTVMLKLIAAALGPAVVFGCAVALHRRRVPWDRYVRWAAWTAAVVLTAYGAVLTGAGLLVQAGVISTPADADHHALRWHAYFWDPWFLVWGLALVLALVQHRALAPEQSRRRRV